jgi:hypothetical protein
VKKEEQNYQSTPQGDQSQQTQAPTDNQEQNYQPPPQYGQNQQMQPPKRGNGLGIAALVVGIVAIIGSWIPIFNVFSLVFGFVALGLGIGGLVMSRKGRPKGTSIAGLALAGITIIIFVAMYATAANVAGDIVDKAVGDAVEDVLTTEEEPIQEEPVEEEEVVDESALPVSMIAADNVQYSVSVDWGMDEVEKENRIKDTLYYFTYTENWPGAIVRVIPSEKKIVNDKKLLESLYESIEEDNNSEKTSEFKTINEIDGLYFEYIHANSDLSTFDMKGFIFVTSGEAFLFLTGSNDLESSKYADELLSSISTIDGTPIPYETAPSDEETDKKADEEAASSGDADWEQFLDEYEAWVDEYVAFMKKLKENPSDTSLLTDSLSLTQKSLEWAEKSEEVRGDLSTADAVEYTKRLLKIQEKIMNAAL